MNILNIYFKEMFLKLTTNGYSDRFIQLGSFFRTDYLPLSLGYRLSIRSNIFSPETTEPIEVKFHFEHLWLAGNEFFYNWPWSHDQDGQICFYLFCTCCLTFHLSLFRFSLSGNQVSDTQPPWSSFSFFFFFVCVCVFCGWGWSGELN